jgi:hypothetical protein
MAGAVRRLRYAAGDPALMPQQFKPGQPADPRENYRPGDMAGHGGAVDVLVSGVCTGDDYWCII